MNIPHIIARKKVPVPVSKRSFYFFAFILLLLMVAMMTFYSSYHLHNVEQDSIKTQTMSSIIKKSEEKILLTAGKVYNAIDRTTNLIQHKWQDLNSHSLDFMLPHETEILVPKRKKIAYAITITKDGFFQDGAAVLAYSIMKYSQNTTYDISFIAFVHPNVTTSRIGLERLGFHVIEVPTPVNTSAIRFDFLRDHIDKNGCCGAAELIKLTSYRLTQYHRVVHLDADTMFLNSIDELFTRNYSLIYTTDPNMATHKGEDKMPVQGGFIVMQPSEEVYRSLVDIVMNTEFAKGGAWNRSKIGWFWGGMTVQGVLPYYYNRVSVPGRSQIIDRCYYNTMADTPPCSVQRLEELKSAHFTVCQKPWGCWRGNYVSKLCGELHERWFSLRQEAEIYYNLPITKNPCPRGGHKHYKPMQLDKVQLPLYNETELYRVSDHSLDRYIPIKEAKYISNHYN